MIGFKGWPGAPWVRLPRGSSYFGLVTHQGGCLSPSLSHHALDTISRMADYFDYPGVNSGHIEAGPSSFVRPLNLADRKSGQSSFNSRASGASGITYATNGSAPIPEESQHDPAEPIRGMPTPVMRVNGLRLPADGRYDDEDEEDEEDDDDPEYMMVDADLSMVSQFGAQDRPPQRASDEPPPKVMNNKPVPVKVQGGRKGFVGGFVSGLRRLPRLLRNQRGTVQRQPSHDTVSELPGFGEDSPGYDPFRAHPPFIQHPSSIQHPTSILQHPPPAVHHAPSIPASRQVTSMHYSHYTHDERSEPSERSESPRSRDPRDFDEDELEQDQHHSGSDDEEDQRSAHGPSTAAHSTHQSTRFSSHPSAHHSNRPSTHTHQSNQNSSHKSNHHSNHASPHRSTTPSRPQTALDGDTTLIQQTQNGEPDPVATSPLPTADYKSMAPESTFPPGSIAANVGRVQQFINDVYSLPWVATRVTADYVPARDGRQFRGLDPNEKRSPKPPKSWYPIHQDIDLLEGESQPQSAPVMAHRRRDGHRRALTESTVSPASAAISHSVTPSTTYSNGRRYSVNSEPSPRHPRHTRDFRHTHHRHRRRYRDHSRPHSPPIYPVLASPQPLYLYPGPGSPPIMPIPQPVHGSSASSPRSKRAITSPAVPVYMIPVPPPVYQPMSGFHYAPQPTHSQPAQSQPSQPQPAQSQPAQSQPPKNPSATG